MKYKTQIEQRIDCLAHDISFHKWLSTSEVIHI